MLRVTHGKAPLVPVVGVFQPLCVSSEGLRCEGWSGSTETALL